MARFSTRAFGALNPLLTFRCLSNMPAFHISVCFDLQGPYSVAYPGAGQLYLALEQAAEALRSRRIDVALVCGVAHQRNLLVEHHFARLEPAVEADQLVDAAGCLVLERAEDAGARARGRLLEVDVSYAPLHPLEDAVVPQERLSGAAALPEGELGPGVAAGGGEPGTRGGAAAHGVDTGWFPRGQRMGARVSAGWRSRAWASSAPSGRR